MILMIITLGYLTIQTIRMGEMRKDSYSSLPMRNDFVTGYDQFQLNGTTFMPTFSLTNMARTTEDLDDLLNSNIDIFKSKTDRKNLEYDFGKLSKYVKFRLKMRKREGGKHLWSDRDEYWRIDFRQCTIQDFNERNFFPKPEEIAVYEYRMCPDIGFLKDELAVRNGYSNITRTSFSFEIEKCDKK